MTHQTNPTLPTVAIALVLLGVTVAACQASSSGSGPRPGPGAGSPPALDGPNTAVVEWSEAAYDGFVAEEKYGHPMRAVRVFAMVHTAQHDALAAIRPIYAPHAFTGNAPDADPVAAAASAAFEVLAAELPGQRTTLAARLARTVAAAADRSAAEAGVALGQQAAAAVLQRRHGDGGDTQVVVPMEPSDRPGVYSPVPPATFIAAPGWQHVHPFGLQTARQFRVGPPPALDSAEYTSAFDEVKRLGRKGSTARTADQSALAAFWYEFSDIGWNRVARVVSTERKLGLQATARLFALLNMAMSDAYVAGWDSKMHHNFWRPATAIRRADSDGNASTAADAAWEPEHPTPPIQDHPSTHSALGDAAAEILASVFGDATPFSFTSTSALPSNPVRTFASFKAAADENADSRVLAGLHFRFACRTGQALGRQVGAWVVATALQPVKSVALAR